MTYHPDIGLLNAIASIIKLTTMTTDAETTAMIGTRSSKISPGESPSMFFGCPLPT